MTFDKLKIKETLDEVSKRWDLSGYFFLMKDSKMLHRNHYGYENRERGIKTTERSLYTLDSKNRFFVNLATLIAIDKKLLKLDDTLNQLIPEMTHSDKITIEHLLRDQTGLVDFYYEKVMVDLESDQALQEKTFEDRVRVEKMSYYENRSFEKVCSMIESCDLEYEPGKKTYGSSTNTIVLEEALKRVIKTDIFDYLQLHVFKPLNMTVRKHEKHDGLSYTEHKRTQLVSMPFDNMEGLFDVTANEMIKFMVAIGEKKLISKALWKKVLKYNSKTNGILLENANGYDCLTTQFLGYGFYCYVNHKTGVSFASLTNEQQTFELIENSWHYFRRDSREAVASVMTYPVNTKMVRLNKQNFWDALDIAIDKAQHNFVLEARASIAMGLMYNTKRVYVQMEDSLVVGLLVLNIDKKKDDYNVDIIIIDKKYQGRGYGKLMVKWAVEELKKHGAKKLSIGVSRENIGAKKIYMNAGFEPKSVSDGGMELEMKL